MNITAENFTVSLDAVLKASDVIYSIARGLVVIIIFFGLLYYLGRLSIEGHRLKKPSRFETDLRNYAWGLLITLSLLGMVAVIASIVPPKMLTSPTIFFSIFGVVEFVIILWIWIAYAYSQEPAQVTEKTTWREKLEKLKQPIIFGVKSGIILTIIFILLVAVIPIVLLLYPPYQQLAFNLSILFVLILLIAYSFLSGRFMQPTRHEVSVYLFDASEPLENLVLYQTTEVDYRFKKGNEEIIIPISQVKKIEYKTPPKEDSKRVSARVSCEERSSERSADKG